MRKNGFYKQKQCWQCKDCGTVFILKKHWAERAREEYCFGRLSYTQIGKKYGKCTRSVQRNFDKLRINYFLHTPQDKHINLSLDGVYFGWSLCYVVFRAGGKTIYFKRCSETINNVSQCLRELADMGYTFKSFTIDGKKGMSQRLQKDYPDIPVQYCHFHQKKTVRRYLTKQPKTECGQAIKELLVDLKEFDRPLFVARLNALAARYKYFLAERNEKRKFMHQRVRSALRSLNKNAELLFTYKTFEHLKIPNTTNTCEGYFSQIKRKVRAHPGLTRPRLIRLIERLFCEQLKT